MDWSVVAVLAAITWLEGVRRVPRGALVLRRVLRGPWRVAETDDAHRVWRLVSWWSPLTLGVVVTRDGRTAGSTADAAVDTTHDAMAARLAASRRVVGALRVLGAITLATLVFGVPAAVARFGAWGFGGAVGAMVIIGSVTVLTAARTLRSFGYGRSSAARAVLPLLSPFSAPRAAEVVLEHAAAGSPALAAARQLLGPARFAAWVRPIAYDALNDAGDPADSRALVALVGTAGVAEIVDEPPAACAAGERYCPRCARVYRADVAACGECASLRLASMPNGSPRRSVGSRVTLHSGMAAVR